MRQFAGLVVAGVLTLPLSGCFIGTGPQSQAIVLDGRSASTAIPVPGVDAEYQWLATHRPGWHPDRQALLVGDKGRSYDVITITRGGQSEDIFFDITSFFGKPA